MAAGQAMAVYESGGERILPAVPFLSIEFNLEALRKLAERGISVDEVTEVFQTTPVVWIENLTRELTTAAGWSARREQAVL